ncbi:putative secreted protein [Wickerhamomyces ciferrii]|uniref:Maintenance of telomere capping protein 6 n=1 Tax=Wickerhamomyces ciferrii (strain ATCC 14091 / BCRC 22168 / CBS 111 / JCM 3599 / NBRC 0793 / NRRL Y-1031 F-60-10) TaxID=1206466 RepID=K0KJZ5_WICCF|nr:uncharacterized protein BN7_989 [Wickerhamomyces ciferrii]CCH41448.1 putative secreted protein [Wickerhamomyces ciferrii]
MRLALIVSVVIQTLLMAQGAYGLMNYPSLSSNRVTAIRSQRDVAANVSIDQITTAGIRLSKTLFDREGYTNDTLKNVWTLLNGGIQNLVIDIYWNENTGEFQLCPIDMSGRLSTRAESTGVIYYDADDDDYKCDNVLTLQGLIDVVFRFTSETDTNLSANLILLMFNTHGLLKKSSSNSQNNDNITYSNNNTLSQILQSTFSYKLYTPSALTADRFVNRTYNSEEQSNDGFPTVSHFLFTDKRRVVSTIWQDNLPSNTTYNLTSDYNIVFPQSDLNSSFTSLNNTVVPSTEEEFINTANGNWRFAYDDDNTKFNNGSIRHLIDWGYSPILNSAVLESSDIASIFNTSLWSWDSAEPLEENIAKEINKDSDNTRNSQTAYKCAALSSTGWKVENCYDSKYVACRKQSRAFEWELSLDKQTYFNAEDVCPDNTNFSVPRTALQQYSLVNYLKTLPENHSIWIDMNSISINDCWVTGGPNSNCPYQKVTNERNFAEMLTPASVFCLVIFLGMILLRLKRVPVQDNRKHWKKLLQQNKENEYEGVPS